MGLVLIGSLMGFTMALGGLILGLSPGVALFLWMGSAPATALVVIVASWPKWFDDDHSEPAGALPVFA